MLKTILFDDEFNSLQRLKGIVEKEQRLDIIELFQRPEEFLKFMDDNWQEIDLVFLDIQMPGIKGLNLAENIQPDWATAKTEELFLFLLRYEGNYVSKGKIIDNLWQDRPADRAKDILYTTIYNLRRTFKKFGYSDLIKGKRGYYKLNKKLLESDILKQKELISDYNSDKIAEADFLNQMEEIHEGEFLEDKNYGWTYAYQIEVLKNYKNLVEKITEKYLEAESHDKAKSLLENLTSLDPLDEMNYKYHQQQTIKHHSIQF